MTDHRKPFDGSYPSSMYHPTEAPDGLCRYYEDREEARAYEDQLIKQGWVDTPAKIDPVVVDDAEPTSPAVTDAEVPQEQSVDDDAGEDDGVEEPTDADHAAEALNAIVGQDKPDKEIKAELEAFALEQFGVNIDKRKSVEFLEGLIKSLINGDHNQDG